VAAAIEQNHDDRGIIWPPALAPFRVAVLPLGAEPAITEAAEKIYAALTEAGVEAVIDDRPETPGVKFADADLMGIPLQVLVGKTFTKEGLVEIKKRGQREGLKVAPGEVPGKIRA
jgi:prolyl-tRNA synthetase